MTILHDATAAESSGNTKVSVIVIGGGYFAQFHINAWLRLPGVELQAIVEKDTSKHADLKTLTSHSNTRITDSLETALGSLAPDILDIATPPDSHFELINQAINLQCKLLICQKPFCGDLKTAKNCCKIVDNTDSTVVVHENFRFQPWYRKIKSVLDKNSLGKVLQTTFRLRPGDGQGVDAYLQRQPYFRTMEKFLIHETGIHFIDVFRYLFGEPESVSAELQTLNTSIAGEDSGHFIFYYKNGLRAHFDGNRLLDHSSLNPRLTMGEMLIEGTEACLSLNGSGELHLRLHGQTDWQPITFHFDDTDFGGDCVYHLQKHIVDHIQTGSALENSADVYLKNLQLEALVYKASNTKRQLTLQDSAEYE